MDKYVKYLSAANSQTQEWQRPKKPAKRPREDANEFTVATKNKFANLQITSVPEVAHKNTRVPPIIMKAGKSHSETMGLIKNCIGENFFLRYTRNGNVAVHVKSVSDHAKLRDGLKNNLKPFHTFTLDAEKCRKAVIKGLHLIDVDEIKRDIAEQGFEATSVVALNPAKGSTRFPCYLVNLPQTTDMGKFKTNIKYICHTKVTIEKYRNKSIGSQCFRCQAFGHAARNCNWGHRCLKCAENHPTSSCTKDRETPAKCCNCGEAHTANYSFCKAKVSYVGAILSSKSARQRPTGTPVKQQAEKQPTEREKRAALLSNITSFPPLPTRRNQQRAPEPKPQQEQHTSRPAEQPNAALGALNDIAEVKKLMSSLIELKNKIKNCNSQFDKMEILLDFLSNFD